LHMNHNFQNYKRLIPIAILALSILLNPYVYGSTESPNAKGIDSSSDLTKSVMTRQCVEGGCPRKEGTNQPCSNCFDSGTFSEPTAAKGGHGLGWVKEKISTEARVKPEKAKTLGLPTRLDWRGKDGVDWTTPIRDQGGCGSCVAFGTVAVVESALRIQSNSPGWNLDLSEQHLFSCGGGICAVGWYISASLNYLRAYGTPSESCFPYWAADLSCSNTCPNWQSQAQKISSWNWLSNDTVSIETSLQYAPVVAAIDVYSDFFSYHGGIYRHTSGGYVGGHCVAIVGYDNTEGYWICKNSWGTSWGESGWFRIAFGECGIDDYVTAVKVSGLPILSVSLISPPEAPLYTSSPQLKARVVSSDSPVQNALARFYVDSNEVGSCASDTNGYVSYNYSLAAKTVTWLQFQVLDATGAYNPGLTEIEVYNQQGTSNVARSASVTASSEYSPSYAASNIIDGIKGVWDQGEWASQGSWDKTPWLKLTWSSPQTINKLVLYGRPNKYDAILNAKITLSNGYTATLGEIPSGGAAKEVYFPTSSYSWYAVAQKSGYNSGTSPLWSFTYLSTSEKNNLASSAAATASSEFSSQYTASNAIDGVEGIWDQGEWAANGAIDKLPWLQLTWAAPQTINKLVIYGRPNKYDAIVNAKITLSNGFTMTLGEVPSGGAAKEVYFPTTSVTWVKIDVLETAPTCLNAGLTEVEAYDEAPNPSNLAGSATASTSSEYSSAYKASNAIDDVKGVWGQGEWAAKGATDHFPWLKLTWTSPRTINELLIYGRPNKYDAILNARITLSNGYTVTIGEIPSGGAAKEIYFPTATVTWVSLDVLETAPTCLNAGLTEIELFNAP
jgi:C1A family cysteine protease